MVPTKDSRIMPIISVLAERKGYSQSVILIILTWIGLHSAGNFRFGLLFSDRIDKGFITVCCMYSLAEK